MTNLLLIMKTINLGFIKIFVAFIVFQLLSTTSSYGQSVTGPTEVSLGLTYTYRIAGVTGVRNTTWFVPYGGEVVSSNSIEANVKWVSGTSSVVATFSDMYGNEYTANLPVTQGPPAPATPPAPTIQSNDCGSTTLSRGSPPAGITYYWQSNSTGTSTSNSSATITKTTAGTQYLRAYSSSTGTWSNASSKAYTVIAFPPPPSALATVVNECGITVLVRP